ncbi:MAG TPA: VWA domain-containing protein [Bryobacteraceae bacterium]|nr:VWA domain-containing protein [Bryobacteraceae bacterium]
MRAAAVFFILTATAGAQFKSTTQLVVAPTTVTDEKGRFVDGLTPDDLILTDNSVRQAIQMDWMTYPIDLVVAVQTSANSGPVIDKLGGAGILLSQMLAGGAGETAMISFSDTVKLHQDFTADPDKVTNAMRMLRMEGGDAHELEAIGQALTMLAARPPARRRIILMIAEKRDRGSDAKLPEVMAKAQRLNAAVYWVTWSPFLQPFTVKNKVKEDLKPIAARQPFRACISCPRRDETPVPYEPGPGGLVYALGELAHLTQPDLSTLFTETTGGRALGFLKKDALEQAIQLISLEVHRQYILTFQAPVGQPGAFHSIQVTVKGYPKLRVSTRSGYWAVE